MSVTYGEMIIYQAIWLKIYDIFMKTQKSQDKINVTVNGKTTRNEYITVQNRAYIDKAMARTDT
jgi:hypothetical protein